MFRSTKMKSMFISLSAAAFLAMAPGVNATIIAAWDFENAATNQLSGIAASTLLVPLSDAAFNTTNVGVEDWGTPADPFKLLVTRFFDSSVNFPWLSFTLDESIDNVWLTFNQFSNHNPNFPTSPQYNYAVQMQIDNVWQDVARDLVAKPSTWGNQVSVKLATSLQVGSYNMRWIGYNYAYGSNSRSEYFALDNVAIKAIPEPMTLSIFALALLGLAYRRQRQQRR